MEIVVQSLSRVWLSVTPWTVAHQAPLSFTIFWSLLKLFHWITDSLWHPLNHSGIHWLTDATNGSYNLTFTNEEPETRLLDLDHREIQKGVKTCVKILYSGYKIQNT